MNLGITFTTRETPDMARQLIGAYLERAGYKPVGAAPAFVYRRGSKLGSMIGFSARHWHATVTLQLLPGQDGVTQTAAALDVNTSGQLVVRREQEPWQTELDGLVAAAGGTNVETLPLAAAR